MCTGLGQEIVDYSSKQLTAAVDQCIVLWMGNQGCMDMRLGSSRIH